MSYSSGIYILDYNEDKMFSNLLPKKNRNNIEERKKNDTSSDNFHDYAVSDHHLNETGVNLIICLNYKKK